MYNNTEHPDHRKKKSVHMYTYIEVNITSDLAICVLSVSWLSGDYQGEVETHLLTRKYIGSRRLD